MLLLFIYVKNYSLKDTILVSYKIVSSLKK